jgi:hypothetical protein
MPVILAMQEAQAGGMWSEAVPRQNHITISEKLLKQKGLEVWLYNFKKL